MSVTFDRCLGEKQHGKCDDARPIIAQMTDNTKILRPETGKVLRRGWTTGACATAATRAALHGLWTGSVPDRVRIILPKGERPEFDIMYQNIGPDFAEVGLIKDAGDDPDVTHGAEVRVRVKMSENGVVFKAGDGVGIVTKAGLPIGVGEPAINPVPRDMMRGQVTEMAARFGKSANIEITVSIINGAEIALKTWNPRLGIKGGLSILGTTGVVRPFSCSAWIASIHRGIDVARAEGLKHVAGCTGATSETTVQRHYDLPDGAMIDMGDFVGGMVKYLAKKTVQQVTIGGGIGKITKLAQGEFDLHSKRSQVDFSYWAEMLGDPNVAQMNTALEVYEAKGTQFATLVAQRALKTLENRFCEKGMSFDIIVIDRKGNIIGKTT